MPPNEVETVGHPESQYGDQIHRLNRILPDEIPFTLPADQDVRSAAAKLTELGVSQAPVIVGEKKWRRLRTLGVVATGSSARVLNLTCATRES